MKEFLDFLTLKLKRFTLTELCAFKFALFCLGLFIGLLSGGRCKRAAPLAFLGFISSAALLAPKFLCFPQGEKEQAE